ncbi:MAG: phage major capsid protein, partial [Lachnospiraceae bacterium]|nr:phage major capsid protein [Lachnospiraceae bacterium]
MKKYLENVIASKENEIKELRSKVEVSQSAEEVRSISAQVDKLQKDILEARTTLEALKKEGGATEVKGAIPKDAKVVGSFEPAVSEKKSDDVYGTLEYRQAFANYVRTGKWEYRDSSAGMVVTDDIGKVIPTTIMNEIIKELKSYGGIYAKGRKLNIKGNIEFAIEEIMPSVRWIDETTPSEEQSAPELKKSVRFGAYTAEVRIASSLLSAVMALSIFEKELSSIIAESFMKEFDSVILNGDGDGKPLGITKDERVPEDHIITISNIEMNDWKTWRK